MLCYVRFLCLFAVAQQRTSVSSDWIARGSPRRNPSGREVERLRTTNPQAALTPSSLRALPHLPALLLQAASPLLLPLPAEHRARLLVGVRLVRHGAALKGASPRTPPAAFGLSQNGNGLCYVVFCYVMEATYYFMYVLCYAGERQGTPMIRYVMLCCVSRQTAPDI